MILDKELDNAIETLIDDLDEINTSESFQRCIVLSEEEINTIRRDGTVMITYRGVDIQLCRCEW